MTPSLKVATPAMPNSIADDFLPSDSEHISDLQDVFDALDITHATASPHLILRRVGSILDHGINIGFLPQGGHQGNNELQKKWMKWRQAINQAINEFEAKTEPEEYKNDTYSYAYRTKNKAVNLLFYDAMDPQATNRSSPTLGLRLVFLAMLALPPSRQSQINKSKITRLFNSYIVKLRFFPELNLDFTSNTSFNEIISSCEKLTESKYPDPTKTDRQFLDSLKNTLRLLEGYCLGTRKKQPSHTKGVRNTATTSKGKRVARTVRHTPFYSPTENIPNIGSFIEIVPDQGEEPIIGVITPEADEDDNEVPEKIASAVSQVKTKYWLQHFNEATPWNSRGINPLTRATLIEWIKENDTVISLILGLMLSTGYRFEDVLALTIGENGNISSGGIYIRHYTPPENRFTPSPTQETLVERVSQTLRLPLPSIIRDRLTKCCKQVNEDETLGSILGINAELLKKEAQKTIKMLIRKGANGLALDRIHLSLEKRISEITGDEVIGHILAGNTENMPPVSAYYAAYPHQIIEEIYQQAVEDLYR